jgi:hypothetical protein
VPNSLSGIVFAHSQQVFKDGPTPKKLGRTRSNVNTGGLRCPILYLILIVRRFLMDALDGAVRMHGLSAFICLAGFKGNGLMADCTEW